MSWSQYLPEDSIRWIGGYDSHPIWPSEPALSAVRGIVASVLLGDSEEGDDMSVDFLGGGAYHKIYEVSRPTCPTKYILRVAVPVDPCLKMESEVATLEFLRQRTTIPAPKPISWSSRVDERLGYEWSLFEKIPGVELRRIWRNVPWEKKVEITKTVASFLFQIWRPAVKFAHIGSLYFAAPIPNEQGPISIGGRQESFDLIQAGIRKNILLAWALHPRFSKKPLL